MLPIDIPAARYELPGTWDGRSKKLISVPAIHLELEHSLMSISRWESKWKICFTEHQDMTTEQFLDYCRCMTINKQKDPSVYQYLRQQDVVKIANYMHDPMSARIMRPPPAKQRGPRRTMTAEYFYFLMIQNGIPMECEKWHFGRLLALIDCCQSNSGDGPKMSYREKQQYYATLNAQRRKLLGTTG